MTWQPPEALYGVSPPLLLHRALRLMEQAFGEKATLAQVYLHFGRKPPGRPVIAADASRHARMAELWTRAGDELNRRRRAGLPPVTGLDTPDEELLRRRYTGDWNLAFLARLVIKEAPEDGELDPDTKEPYASTVKRLVDGFPYFCFDDAERGFSKGLWFK